MNEIEEIAVLLASMRKNEGLTLSKIANNKRLLEILGVVNPDLLYRFLAAGIDNLPDTQSIEAVRMALNISVQHEMRVNKNPGSANLTARRRRLADKWGRDVSTVRSHEDIGFRELALWIRANSHHFVYVDELAARDETHVFVEEDTTYIFQRGRLRSVHYEAEVRSLELGMEYVNVRFPFVLGVPYTIKDEYPMYGCAIDNVDYGPQETVITVEFSRTLGFGEPHRFSLGFYVDADPGVTRIRTPLSRRETSTLRLQCDEPSPYRIIVDGRGVMLDRGRYFWTSWHEFAGQEKRTYIDYVGDDDLLDQLMKI